MLCDALYALRYCACRIAFDGIHRPLKIYYCPPRPGDIWPPQEGMGGRSNGPPGSKPSGNGPPRREKTPKPSGCKKLYAGNLSYNIDDDTMCEFFKSCGTIVGLRWLTHKGSEEFRVRHTTFLHRA